MLILFSLIIINCVSYYCITFAFVICSNISPVVGLRCDLGKPEITGKIINNVIHRELIPLQQPSLCQYYLSLLCRGLPVINTQQSMYTSMSSPFYRIIQSLNRIKTTAQTDRQTDRQLHSIMSIN